MTWKVYIIRCSDDSLYTGISTDVQRRWQQHNEQQRGAKYFRARKPVQIVYLESGHDRSSASQREAAIKKLCRSDKQALITSGINEIMTASQPLENARVDV